MLIKHVRRRKSLVLRFALFMLFMLFIRKHLRGGKSLVWRFVLFMLLMLFILFMLFLCVKTAFQKKIGLKLA